MSRVYLNYRWEPSNKRKGDRWYYKRDVKWTNMPWRDNDPKESQAIATVQYDSNDKSPFWGKWHVSFGAQSPGLHRLRLQEIPKFASKNEAMAWAVTMIRLEGLT